MKLFDFLVMGISCSLLAGCAGLKEPTVRRNQPLDEFRYAVVSKTAGLSASAGGLYGDRSGMYGSSISKTLSPSAVIEGILLKKGLTTVDEVRPDASEKTILVRYGESGRRDLPMGGYTLEVTIVLVSAKTSDLVYSCSAEGIGEAEADDIRQAINRCLSAL